MFSSACVGFLLEKLLHLVFPNILYIEVFEFAICFTFLGRKTDASGCQFCFELYLLATKVNVEMS